MLLSDHTEQMKEKEGKSDGALVYQEQKETLISRITGVEAREQHVIDGNYAPDKQDELLTFTKEKLIFEQIADNKQ